MSIATTPHYEIASSELATWIEEQGTDRWWSVDGDPLLTGRLAFPCPGDELAEELRRLDRPLLLQDKNRNPEARGQRISREELDGLTSRLGDNIHATGAEPAWADDRLFYLCWKGAPDEWLLVEDSETTERSRQDAASGSR
jgi:hypothetical protein